MESIRPSRLERSDCPPMATKQCLGSMYSFVFSPAIPKLPYPTSRTSFISVCHPELMRKIGANGKRIRSARSSFLGSPAIFNLQDTNKSSNHGMHTKSSSRALRMQFTSSRLPPNYELPGVDRRPARYKKSKKGPTYRVKRENFLDMLRRTRESFKLDNASESAMGRFQRRLVVHLVLHGPTPLKQLEFIAAKPVGLTDFYSWLKQNPALFQVLETTENKDESMVLLVPEASKAQQVIENVYMSLLGNDKHPEACELHLVGTTGSANSAEQALKASSVLGVYIKTGERNRVLAVSITRPRSNQEITNLKGAYPLGSCYVFDLQNSDEASLKAIRQTLGSILGARNILKVMLDSRGAIETLKKDLRLKIFSVFDLQVVSSILAKQSLVSPNKSDIAGGDMPSVAVSQKVSLQELLTRYSFLQSEPTYSQGEGPISASSLHSVASVRFGNLDFSKVSELMHRSKYLVRLLSVLVRDIQRQLDKSTWLQFCKASQVNGFLGVEKELLDKQVDRVKERQGAIFVPGKPLYISFSKDNGLPQYHPSAEKCAESVASSVSSSAVGDIDGLAQMFPANIFERIRPYLDNLSAGNSKAQSLSFEKGRYPVIRIDQGEEIEIREVALSDFDGVASTIEALINERMQRSQRQNEKRSWFSMGLPGSIHRLHVSKDPSGAVSGFTVELRTHHPGNTQMIRDLVSELTVRNEWQSNSMQSSFPPFGTVPLVSKGRSLLLLGNARSGKSTTLRGIASFLADELSQRVLVFDRSGQVGQAFIGKDTHLVDVANCSQSSVVMQNAIRAFRPDVIALDEFAGEIPEPGSLKAIMALLKEAVTQGISVVACPGSYNMSDLLTDPGLAHILGQGDLGRKHHGKPLFEAAVEMESVKKVKIFRDLNSKLGAGSKRSSGGFNSNDGHIPQYEARCIIPAPGKNQQGISIIQSVWSESPTVYIPGEELSSVSAQWLAVLSAVNDPSSLPLSVTRVDKSAMKYLEIVDERVRAQAHSKEDLDRLATLELETKYFEDQRKLRGVADPIAAAKESRRAFSKDSNDEEKGLVYVPKDGDDADFEDNLVENDAPMNEFALSKAIDPLRFRRRSKREIEEEKLEFLIANKSKDADAFLEDVEALADDSSLETELLDVDIKFKPELQESDSVREYLKIQVEMPKGTVPVRIGERGPGATFASFRKLSSDVEGMRPLGYQLKTYLDRRDEYEAQELSLKRSIQIPKSPDNIREKAQANAVTGFADAAPREGMVSNRSTIEDDEMIDFQDLPQVDVGSLDADDASSLERNIIAAEIEPGEKLFGGESDVERSEEEGIGAELDPADEIDDLSALVISDDMPEEDDSLNSFNPYMKLVEETEDEKDELAEFEAFALEQRHKLLELGYDIDRKQYDAAMMSLPGPLVTGIDPIRGVASERSNISKTAKTSKQSVSNDLFDDMELEETMAEAEGYEFGDDVDDGSDDDYGDDFVAFTEGAVIAPEAMQEPVVPPTSTPSVAKTPRTAQSAIPKPEDRVADGPVSEEEPKKKKRKVRKGPMFKPW